MSDLIKPTSLVSEDKNQTRDLYALRYHIVE